MQSAFTTNLLKLTNLNIFLHNHIHSSAALNGKPRITLGAYKLKSYRKNKRRAEALSNNSVVGSHVKVQSFTDSVKARGFCKERKSYAPPRDVENHVYKIFESTQAEKLPQDWKAASLANSDLKFKFLVRCIEAFNHDIPNSFLCKIKQVGDVVDYFNTPVSGLSPYETLIRDSDHLPGNLHVIPEPDIFHPDTDTFFDGMTAFPGRKRIVFTKRGQEFEKTIEWPNV